MNASQGSRDVAHAMPNSARTDKIGIAQQFLRKLLKDKDDGRHPSAEVGRLKFGDACAAVVTDYKNNDRRSVAHIERRIEKHLKPFFGVAKLITIGKRDIEEYKAHRRTKNASNGEINRELAIVRRAFRLAELPHPVTMLTEAAARAGFFEPAQFESVRAQLPAYLADVVTFADITGWRISEVLGLEWSRVDVAAREVRLDAGTTKNDEARVFPFTHALADLLTARAEIRDGLGLKARQYVFHGGAGGPIKNFRKRGNTACTNAGLPGRLLHDFRRTAVRTFERAGVPRKVAMQMVGHKTESIYRRYHILDASDLHDAAARLDALTGSKRDQIEKSAGSSAPRQSA